MKARAPGLRTRAAADDFLNDDAHRDSPDRAAPQDDGDWFRRNPARRHRLRPPVGAEVALCAPPQRAGRFASWTAVFAVRRAPSGEITRLPVPWPPGEPLLGEQRARAVFAWSAGMFAQVGQAPARSAGTLSCSARRRAAAAAPTSRRSCAARWRRPDHDTRQPLPALRPRPRPAGSGQRSARRVLAVRAVRPVPSVGRKTRVRGPDSGRPRRRAEPVRGGRTMTAVYGASPAKLRRATKAEMEARAEFLIGYAATYAPVTVRGLYYQAEVAAIPGIDKTENAYGRVQRQVLKLRRAGHLPYEHIADATRWMRKPRSYDSPEDALEATARLYRRNLWRDSDEYVEIWLEKDAIAGVIYPVTEAFDVPLMVTRGFSSETFAFEAIEQRGEDERDYVIYYLGDFDRAGQDAANSLREKLYRFSDDKPFDVYFVELAVTDWQVKRWRLPSREPKRNTPADQAWPHDFACELDAIPPDNLRWLVRIAIQEHLPPDQCAVLKAAEESERAHLRRWADLMANGAAP